MLGQPVEVRHDPRLCRRVPDGDPPGPGEERRLDGRGAALPRSLGVEAAALRGLVAAAVSRHSLIGGSRLRSHSLPGGASGLGEATVRRLHDLGAHVVIADLNQERGTALADELGDRAQFARAYVTSADAVLVPLHGDYDWLAGTG